jgi:hypothetical protein
MARLLALLAAVAPYPLAARHHQPHGHLAGGAAVGRGGGMPQ